VPTCWPTSSSYSTFRVVEGTLGVASCVLFRESARGAALKACRACSVGLVIAFDEGSATAGPPVPVVFQMGGGTR